MKLAAIDVTRPSFQHPRQPKSASVKTMRPEIKCPRMLRMAAWCLLVQTATSWRVDAQMAGVRTERLADSVYAVVRTTRPTDPSDANTLIIVNATDVVVVDGNITPQSTRAVIAEIRKLTSNPVRYVVVTHWHSDHHIGNIEYQRAWPNVEFVAHRNTREEVLQHDVRDFKSITTEQYPKEIARLQALLKAGVKSDGSALSDAEREQANAGMAALQYFIEETSTFSPIPPTLTFEDSLVLHRGARTIVLRYLGNGNTRGDVVVHLPRERVLATGDLVVSPVPFAFGSFPLAWSTTLRRLREMSADVILPGHGEPMRDWRYVEQLHDLMCATISRALVAGGSGVPVDTLFARVNLADHVTRFARGSEFVSRAMRGTFIRPALQGLHGELKNMPAAVVPAGCRSDSSR